MIKQQEKKPKFKAMLEDISEKVSSGGNLSDGLAMYPKTFDNLYQHGQSGRSWWGAGTCLGSTGPISENQLYYQEGKSP